MNWESGAFFFVTYGAAVTASEITKRRDWEGRSFLVSFFGVLAVLAAAIVAASSISALPSQARLLIVVVALAAVFGMLVGRIRLWLGSKL